MSRRGAISNQSGRYESWSRTKVDDGWEREDFDRLPETTVEVDFPKSVISKNTSPDIPFDRSINMYRGCEHGCTYCYARPTHTFLGYSAGLDFETKLQIKPDVAKVLRREINAKSYQCKVIALGTNTDPYQPLESDYKLTQEILEVLLEHRHPVTITTKSWRIVRDLDVLAELAAQKLVSVNVSVTTLDAQLSASMEPRASAPHRRIETIRRLSDQKIPVQVLVAPIIPGLNDHEMEHIMQLAKEAGASAANWIMLRLPLEVSELFTEWLHKEYPLKANRVMSFVHRVRDQKKNDSRFFHRFRGQGQVAQLIDQRFRIACRTLGLEQKLPELNTRNFLNDYRRMRQTALFHDL